MPSQAMMMRRETCWDMVTLVKNTDCDEPWVVTTRRGSCTLFIQSANCCLTLALCLDRSFRVAYCNLFHHDFAVSDGAQHTDGPGWVCLYSMLKLIQISLSAFGTR